MYRITPKCMAKASTVGNSARQQPKGQPKLGVRTRDLATVCSAASTAGTETGSAIDENSILDTVIVGAGISGLTTALVRVHLDKMRIELSRCAIVCTIKVDG